MKECYSKLLWINTVVLLNGLIIKTNLISMDFIDIRKINILKYWFIVKLTLPLSVVENSILHSTGSLLYAFILSIGYIAGLNLRMKIRCRGRG